MKIGIFDSGLGGKLILDVIRQHMPMYDYAYYGDTANVPYGDRSEDEIYELTKAGVEYLMGHEDCLIVILACNTASAETLRRLQDEYLPATYPDRRILGVIIPTLEAVLESDCSRVLLLGTSRTVSSGKYHLELSKRNELRVKIESIAMPTLVPDIEAGRIDAALGTVRDFLDLRTGQGVQYDAVILGCTHYSVLADGIKESAGQGMQVFAQTEIVPDKLQQYLQSHPEISEVLTMNGTAAEYLTGGSD